VGNKRTIPQKIKRCRDELAQLVPEKRQSEQADVHRKQGQRKDEKRD
jgi:hypothetical protein